MTERNWQVEQFEEHRAHLQAVAYRMLGSFSEAEDAVQEAWVRLSRADSSAVENFPGWLTTIVGRVCLDMLRTRRARREDYVGTTLPEPIITEGEGGDPANEVVLADSIGLALFVVLETLAPAERLAFVLHDMFGVPFDEIATIVDRSPAATRQLASRARQRVRGEAPVPDVDLPRQREIVDAFLAAARAGDFEALVEVLDPEVVFRVDSGVGSPIARGPISGAAAVAEQILVRGARFASMARHATVNGTAGAVVVLPHGRAFAVVGFTVAHDRIVAIDLITDPQKLQGIGEPR